MHHLYPLLGKRNRVTRKPIIASANHCTRMNIQIVISAIIVSRSIRVIEEFQLRVAPVLLLTIISGR